MITQQQHFKKHPTHLSAGLLLLCILFSGFAQAQYDQPYRKGRVKHRIGGGVVISLYKNDPHFAVNTKAKAGYAVSYKSEIILGHKTNLLIGLEYMSQGLTFNGYYADTGYTYLYDKTFSYTHEIRYNELQMPIGFKLALNKEADRPVTFYLFGGIGFRYILNSYTVISSDSTQTSPYDGKGSVGFEHHIISPYFNAFYQGGLGLQKNFRASAKAVFFEVTYKYGLSRIHYTGFENSNNINIKESNITILIGLRL
ncbi:MAG: hypothetical protein JWP12_2935 [Bacteroidetes bacterium]|nr:hypothetical protein [Bacteroidota bacterium]